MRAHSTHTFQRFMTLSSRSGTAISWSFLTSMICLFPRYPKVLLPYWISKDSGDCFEFVRMSESRKKRGHQIQTCLDLIHHSKASSIRQKSSNCAAENFLLRDTAVIKYSSQRGRFHTPKKQGVLRDTNLSIFQTFLISEKRSLSGKG